MEKWRLRIMVHLRARLWMSSVKLAQACVAFALLLLNTKYATWVIGDQTRRGCSGWDDQMVSLEVLTWRNTLVRSVGMPLWEARPDSEAMMHILVSHVFMHFRVYFAFGFSDLQNFKITYVKILIFSAVAVGIWINSHRKKMHPYEFMVQFWIKHKREYLLFLESYKENQAN